MWLPHFLVSQLKCPTLGCTKVLEKNGALKPRRITDIEDSFWIVSWQYYCREGCKKSFRGWSKQLMGSLPAFLRLAFPAVLSRKQGLSNRLLTQLRVTNQHKMGPAGVRGLLLELHTKCFNIILNQYLEAIFLRVCIHEGGDSQNSVTPSLNAHFELSKFPPFGNFGDLDQYAGFVPTEFYLTDMLNRAVEIAEPAANQHTSLIRPKTLAIDDSHKVMFVITIVDEFNCMLRL